MTNEADRKRAQELADRHGRAALWKALNVAARSPQDLRAASSILEALKKSPPKNGYSIPPRRG